MTVGLFHARKEAPHASGQARERREQPVQVRQLNKQLGIDDEARPEPERAPVTPLEVIRAKYKGRGAASAG